MIHNIVIPFPVARVIYPHKSVPLWQNSKKIGSVSVGTCKGKKVAKTGLNEPLDLMARGKMVIREGDIINEFIINGFETIEK